METLFGHLSFRFVTQRENLATEGLSYILRRSAAARAALIRRVWPAGSGAPADLAFGTQAAAADGAIPDLVGTDEHGRAILVGEAKFWAGLTEAQPVKYIHRIEAVGGGVLLVIAPQPRLRVLWGELCARCTAASITVDEESGTRDGLISGRVQPGGRLVLVSWALLLATLRSAMEEAGEDRLVADLLQLQGLAIQADSEAFLPLTSEELTATTGRRILQFNELVQDAFTQLAVTGVADGKNMKTTVTNGIYGRYFLLAGHPALLMSNMHLWGKFAFTPLWLRVASSTYGPERVAEIGRALHRLNQHGRSILELKNGYDIPIDLPVGVERDRVLKAVVGQVERVAALLEPIRSMAEVAAGVTEEVLDEAREP
jgi:hypothetical protein